MEENHSYSIGDLSRRSGLSVRTIRFYSDVGVVPASARSASGYRLYDVEAVARLDLVRTLRDLGLPLESIRALLNAQTSLPEVAAAHLKVLDHQIQTLRLRRGVLRAAAKTNTTPEEVALMHRLAKMSEVERQHLIDDFLDDAFGDTNANPELVAMLRAMRPELPDDPEPHQVEAWVELAELVQDPDFRASVRRMAEYQAAERDAGDRTGLHHDLSDYVRERVAAALTAGIDHRRQYGPHASSSDLVLLSVTAETSTPVTGANETGRRRVIRHPGLDSAQTLRRGNAVLSDPVEGDG